MVETETSGRGKRRRVEQEHRPDLNKTAAPRGSAEDIVLPFTKTLPSWKEYESDEVYKRTPQRPHFPSLAYSCELFREGIAAGLTGAFIKCVKTVDDMGEDTPRSKLDVYKETFVMLEEQGFDVRAPLSRINELLSLQNGLPNMLKKEMRGESSNKKAKAGLNKKPSFKTKEMARKSTVKQDRLNFLYEKQREIREGSSKEPKLNKSLVRCKSSFEDKETAK
ncbi:unnamed protein product [Arabidopsis lyrata]|nr:unnamed protein product [Arabidopsis lyrata]